MTVPLLVADDSRLSRRSVLKALPPEIEFTVTEAANGREAIDLLEKNGFRLLLLDLTMPEVDGVGVLEYLADKEERPDVIVISADFQPEKQRIVMDLGAHKFIRKPLDKEELAMTLFELGYL
ncbi:MULTISPECIES: response regulator [unclassified Alteromonas]|uniref:response regulator n=1 Tax=unclassified Alteromonas TaxID=2614992 RepID=UPI000C49D991|nr:MULTISPECIES: response regulator [unclassified Alteromonas]AYA65643.1 response regulator [Alteromonas sp. RKMC-009]MBT78788.1 two-component system response regulator [Alteromonadaceae bacterium]MDO6474452.1 response regulator [Alteromonas sp. 1_MG-2023]